MPTRIRPGRIALACAVALPLTACAAGSPVEVETVADQTSASCGLFFDDFDYTGPDDQIGRAHV